MSYVNLELFMTNVIIYLHVFACVIVRRGLLCQLRPEMGQFGVYRLNISNEECYMHTSKKPVDIYMRKLSNMFLKSCLVHHTKGNNSFN